MKKIAIIILVFTFFQAKWTYAQVFDLEQASNKNMVESIQENTTLGCGTIPMAFSETYNPFTELGNEISIKMKSKGFTFPANTNKIRFFIDVKQDGTISKLFYLCPDNTLKPNLVLVLNEIITTFKCSYPLTRPFYCSANINFN